MQLVQKNVLLGICGGIAAYKTPDLVRKLKAEGANVKVVLTESGSHFVSSLSLQAVSGEKVSTNLLDEDAELGMGHIELARWADIFLIAPATANTIAKLAHGFADDLLTTLSLATQAPLLIAPAMNQQMWASSSCKQNMQTLLDRGAIQLGPASGEQACGDIGFGRMLEPDEIVKALDSYIALESQEDSQVLSGYKLMITAGPTREAIDPVRYISNHSSGKMGYALAEAAMKMGASVTLVSGPVNIDAPEGVKKLDVVSAVDMLQAVEQNICEQDIFIGCAAVADYRIKSVSQHKMKKTSDEDLQLSFVQNPDILREVATRPKPPFTLGFAAETTDLIAHAKKKLANKNLNMIAANDVSNPELGFNSDENALIVITPESEYKLEKASKQSLSHELMKILASEFRKVKNKNK